MNKRQKSRKTDRSLVQIVADLKAESAKQLKAKHARLRRQLADRSRRVTVGARFRARLAKKLADAGFDLSDLVKYHAADYATCRKQLAAQRGTARGLLRERVERQKSLFKHVLQNRERFECSTGNPILRICDWHGDMGSSLQADPEFTVAPLLQNANPSAGINRVTFSATCELAADYVPFGPLPTIASLLSVDTVALFSTTPQRGGLLSVTAFFAPLGTYELAARGDCAIPGYCGVGLDARVNVRLNRRDVTELRAPTQAWKTLLDDFAQADCEAVGRSGVFGSDSEAESIERNRLMNILPGENVVVSAEYSMSMIVSGNAFAAVNLSSPNFGLNVPLVILELES